MAKGAILIGYGSLPTKADVEDAIKSGWIKNADIVSTTSFPAGTEPNGDLHFMTYLIMKREKGWDDPGDLQSMKITTADKRVIYSVYPSEGVDTLRTTPQSTHQQTMSTKWWEIGRKQSDNDSNSQQPFQSFSSFDAAQVGEEMGEMYFQCPNCGAYERVNDIGKMMLKSDPNYFTSIDCIKCKYTYNARVRIQKGRCPGFDYTEMDEAKKQKEEELEKDQIEKAKIDEVKSRLSDGEMAEVVKEARAFALEYFGSDEDAFLQMSIDSIIKTTYLDNDQIQSQPSNVQLVDNAEVKVCWSCKQEIQPLSIVGSMYCSNCGVVLSKSEPSQEAENQILADRTQNCRSCKNTISPLRIKGQLYCPECGVNL